MHKLIFLLLLGCMTHHVLAQTYNDKWLKANMAKLGDNLYAAKFETTNLDYRLFLASFQSSNTTTSYKQYEVDTVQWEKADAKPLAEQYHRHPAFDKYPVVNVSYEGAEAYCKWLSEKYNSDPKRSFKKVQFVLPTEAEWISAARGGRPQAMFPWGNFYLRNNRGEYLCNFKHVTENNIYADSTGKPVVAPIPAGLNSRAIYTATVKSFYPNDYGMYNCSGNASEMVAEKTFTKGGSWNSYGYYMQTNSREEFKGASPQVGFRVFMRVLEH